MRLIVVAVRDEDADDLAQRIREMMHATRGLTPWEPGIGVSRPLVATDDDPAAADVAVDEAIETAEAEYLSRV